MPGGWPSVFIGGLCNASIDPGSYALTSGLGTRLTAAGSTNTKGSWAQLSAATASDACWVEVQLVFYGATGTSALVDIGIGGSGSEIALFPNLVCANGFGNGGSVYTYSFPCQLPAGTRIAARAQANDASDNNIFASVRIFDGAYSAPECAGLDAINANTSTSLGTAITSGATAAKGSYTQLTASSSRDYLGVLLAFDGQGANNGGANQFEMFDIAIGGSGSEKIIIPDFQTNYQYGWMSPTVSSFIAVSIPSGTRIAARMSDALAGSQVAGISLYGVF